MDRLQTEITSSYNRYLRSLPLAYTVQTHGLSKTLESYSYRTDLEYSLESLNDVVTRIREKFRHWISSFQEKLRTEARDDFNSADYSDDADYEMPISETTARKFTALKIAGIALAGLLVVWIAKGGKEIYESKRREYQYKRHLKDQARRNADNFKAYIQTQPAYRDAHETNKFRRAVLGKERIQQAMRAYEAQKRELDSLIKRDKEMIKQRIHEHRAYERSYNGYLWTGHKVKSFAKEGGGCVGDTLKVLRQGLSGISQSFSSKGTYSDDMSLGHFLSDAIRLFFKIFGTVLWDLIKNFGRMLKGVKPVYRR